MKTVFIGGSRKVSRLNDQIRKKLAEIADRGFHIVVGDANGADRAVQAQLHEWQYPSVTVHFVGDRPRHNEGRWPTERAQPPAGARGAEYYAAKDVVMAQGAEAGLMLWDGESKGTLSNIRKLVRRDCPVSIYLAPARRFVNVLDDDGLSDLLSLVKSLRTSKRTEKQPELSLGVATKPMRRKGRARTA